MTKNRTPKPVYLDPGMHPVLEVKGLTRLICSAKARKRLENCEFQRDTLYLARWWVAYMVLQLCLTKAKTYNCWYFKSAVTAVCSLWQSHCCGYCCISISIILIQRQKRPISGPDNLSSPHITRIDVNITLPQCCANVVGGDPALIQHYTRLCLQDRIPPPG